jgi:hypothetical protein
MSHGSATPPSRATRALHGAPGTANFHIGIRSSLQPKLSPVPRPLATIAHPLFSGLIRRPLLMAASVILFLSGLFAGHFATTAWPGAGNWFGSEKPVDQVVLDKLNTELRLTPAQTARITPIITASCTDLRILSEEGRAQRLAVLDEVGATIAPDLSDDQQRRLESVQAEWQTHPPVKRDQRIVALF